MSGLAAQVETSPTPAGSADVDICTNMEFQEQGVLLEHPSNNLFAGTAQKVCGYSPHGTSIFL